MKWGVHSLSRNMNTNVGMEIKSKLQMLQNGNKCRKCFVGTFIRSRSIFETRNNDPIVFVEQLGHCYKIEVGFKDLDQ